MSQTAVKQPKKAASSDYISLQEFQKQITEASQSNYKGKFSFQPFIDAVQNRADTSCPIGNGLLSAMKERLSMLPDAEKLLKHPEALGGVIPLLFPALFTNGQMGFIAPPFKEEFLFTTKPLQKFLEDDTWETRPGGLPDHAHARHGNLDAGAMILKRFYGVEIDLYMGEILRVRNRKNGLEKHFKFNPMYDFIQVKALQPLKEISPEMIHRLQDEWYNADLWEECFPPENFTFEGFMVGQVLDVSDREILAAFESMMSQEEGNIDFEDGLAYIQSLVRSLLNIPELTFGSLYVQESQWQESTTWGLLRRFDAKLMRPAFSDPDGVYGQAILEKKAVTVGDLRQRPHVNALENTLMENGFRSLLIAPVYFGDGIIGGVMELASPLPYRFNQLTVLKLEELITSYGKGMAKFVQEINNQVRLTIQQQFTSIHPSVEWKFREAATDFYWNKTSTNPTPNIRPIVFRDVYPLYGQADIVSSSKLRNKFIQADLIENLEKVNKVMETCRKHIRFHLLEVYLQKTNTSLTRLKNGEFISSDETEIVGLLNREVHPLLRQMQEHYPKIPAKVFEKYFVQLDPELGIIYHQRKDYEESVSMLNESIASHLEAEDEKMQEVLPHYFEKYQTDGVEYNLYIGQDILEKGEFSPFFLKDFRLWQLIHMCETTRLVEEKAKEMKVPLTTAQLIFVYNHSLSIRFRMDEKQFDVDGAYNVRYEILKKRIDKALVKGTGERLTQSGKIAIVYLGENDKREYLEYLEHLAGQGYITENIEDLELEKLQGADGLRALRVTVF